MNHGLGLAIDSRQQVKNLAIQRKISLRIERERANQRHFLLGQEWDYLFFSSRNKSCRHSEDLLFLNEAFDVCARGRRRVTSVRELHLKLAVVNSALTVKFVEESRGYCFHSLAHVRQRASCRAYGSNYDLAFTNSRVPIFTQTFQISDQVQQVLSRHCVPWHDVQ